MSLPRRWLAGLIDEALASPSPDEDVRAASLARPSAQGRERRFGPAPQSEGSVDTARSTTRARRLIAAAHFHRGLAFGAPILRSAQVLSKEAGELLALVRFLAVLADQVDLVARTLDVVPTREARARAFTTALALVYGTDEDTQVLAASALPARADKALLSIERELVKRRYLQGNPILGLTLHPAFMAIDARAVAMAAVEVYRDAPAPRRAAELQARLAAERLAVLAAIARLSEWREEIDAELTRSASLWQVRALGLPRPETARLVEQTRNPADLSRLVTLVPDDAVDVKERVFLHTVLAACVDGRVSPEERAFLRSLTDALGLAPVRARRIERRVLAFARAHRRAYDPVSLAAGFAATSPPISVRIARIVFDNIDPLWEEIRETGDLAVLLARRAAGQKLSDVETKRMREQLVDVAKAVPSLAVFSLPGGFVLLPIVLKLLPFDLRPSSFKKSDERSFHAFAKGAGDALTADDMGTREMLFLERQG
jgi:hypothetical protein